LKTATVTQRTFGSRWSRRELYRGQVNHRVSALLVKEPTNRISVKLARGFQVLGNGFHQLLKMLPKCAGEEVLAGFGSHHTPSIEDGQIIVPITRARNHLGPPDKK
jgi:hypothetical protein